MGTYLFGLALRGWPHLSLEAVGVETGPDGDLAGMGIAGPHVSTTRRRPTQVARRGRHSAELAVKMRAALTGYG